MTLVALGLSCLGHTGARLAAAIAAFLAAFLTLLAFLADIALYGWVKRQMGKLAGVESDTATGPGESFASFRTLPLPLSLLSYLASSLSSPPSSLHPSFLFPRSRSYGTPHLCAVPLTVG